MTDRNWEQELAKIDKQLASVSDDQLRQQANAPRAGVPANTSAKPAVAAKAPVPVAPSKGVGSWFAWLQLIVAIAAATGLWFWPWETRCGLNAVAFTAATGAVTLVGLWSAIGSWKHRQAYAHILSFAVMIWGLVLGAREVLPRVGYAIPSMARPAGWQCEAPTVLPAQTVPPAGAGSAPGNGSLIIPAPPPSNGVPGGRQS
jgi:hypothetical protein